MAKRFFQGEYSLPHQPPPWYGRPVYTLCLTECDMVFGGVITGERGDARGALKLSLSTGHAFPDNIFCYL